MKNSRPIFAGIHPVGPCLERLYWQEVLALPRLMACECPEGLKQAAIANQPDNVAARQADLVSAVLWELQRYGAVSLPSNPYHQPQIYGASARKAVAA